MLMWGQNLGNAGSEPGGGPVGPQSGKGLMLLYVGRMVTMGLFVYELAREFLRRG